MKNGLKIAFFGSSLTSAYWNGAATYYRGIIKALNGYGYKTTFYEPDAYSRQEHRDIGPPSWARVRVYGTDGEEGVRKALDEAKDADIIVKASGVGAFDALLEEAVIDVKKPGALAIFWDVDAPATLERIKNDPKDPFIGLIPGYDLVLTYGGGRPVVDGYRSFGASECVPIYNALDPATHFPAQKVERFSGALGFLGNRLPDREARVWEFFFNPASVLASETFVLGGNGWDVPGLRNIKYLGHVYTRDHNAFNCSVKAVLNVNRDSMARYGFSPPTRVFEAAGAGACIITDAWEGIELFLEPGREVLVAKNGQEVASHLEALGAERALSIGKAALRRVTAEHTYAHRAKELTRLLNIPAGKLAF